jgi:hypothetical protein
MPRFSETPRAAARAAGYRGISVRIRRASARFRSGGRIVRHGRLDPPPKPRPAGAARPAAVEGIRSGAPRPASPSGGGARGSG